MRIGKMRDIGPPGSRGMDGEGNPAPASPWQDRSPGRFLERADDRPRGPEAARSGGRFLGGYFAGVWPAGPVWNPARTHLRASQSPMGDIMAMMP